MGEAGHSALSLPQVCLEEFSRSWLWRRMTCSWRSVPLHLCGKCSLMEREREGLHILMAVAVGGDAPFMVVLLTLEPALVVVPFVCRWACWYLPLKKKKVSSPADFCIPGFCWRSRPGRYVLFSDWWIFPTEGESAFLLSAIKEEIVSCVKVVLLVSVHNKRVLDISRVTKYKLGLSVVYL